MARSSTLRRVTFILMATTGAMLGGCTVRDMFTGIMVDDPNVDHLTREALGINSDDGSDVQQHKMARGYFSLDGYPPQRRSVRLRKHR